MMIVNKENKYTKIERMFFNNFSYQDISNKIELMKLHFSEQELLNYFLSKVKALSFSSEGLTYFYPMLYLDKNLLTKESENILDNIPLDYFKWFDKYIGKNATLDSLYKSYIFKVLSQYRTISAVELSKILKEKIKEFLSKYQEDFDVESKIAEIFGFYARKKDISLEQNRLAHELLQFKARSFHPMWQDTFYSLITEPNDTILRISATRFNLSDEIIEKVINHYNNLVNPCSQDAYTIENMIDIFLDKFPELVNMDKFSDIILYHHKYAGYEFFKKLDDRGMDTTSLKSKFVEHYWYKVKSGEQKRTYSTITHYAEDINDEKSIHEFIEHLMKPESVSVLMREPIGDLNTYSGSDDEKKEISRFLMLHLSPFVLQDANKNNASYEFLKKIMLETRSTTLLKILAGKFSILDHKDDIVPLVLSRIASEFEEDHRKKDEDKKPKDYERAYELRKVIQNKVIATKYLIAHLDLELHSGLLNRLIALNVEDITQECHKRIATYLFN